MFHRGTDHSFGPRNTPAVRGSRPAIFQDAAVVKPTPAGQKSSRRALGNLTNKKNSFGRNKPQGLSNNIKNNGNSKGFSTKKPSKVSFQVPKSVVRTAKTGLKKPRNKTTFRTPGPAFSIHVDVELDNDELDSSGEEVEQCFDSRAAADDDDDEYGPAVLPGLKDIDTMVLLKQAAIKTTLPPSEDWDDLQHQHDSLESLLTLSPPPELDSDGSVSTLADMDMDTDLYDAPMEWDVPDLQVLEGLCDNM